MPKAYVGISVAGPYKEFPSVRCSSSRSSCLPRHGGNSTNVCPAMLFSSRPFVRQSWFVLVVCLQLFGCFGAAAQRALDLGNVHAYRVINTAPLATGPFTVEIEKMQTGYYATNYFIDVTIRNTSDQVASFDASTVELLDEATGLSYFSFSKDKTVIGGAVGSDIISLVQLGPKRAIQGKLLIATGHNKATAQRLQLRIGDASTSVEHLRRLTGADLPEH